MPDASPLPSIESPLVCCLPNVLTIPPMTTTDTVIVMMARWLGLFDSPQLKLEASTIFGPTDRPLAGSRSRYREKLEAARINLDPPSVPHPIRAETARPVQPTSPHLSSFADRSNRDLSNPNRTQTTYYTPFPAVPSSQSPVRSPFISPPHSTHWAAPPLSLVTRSEPHVETAVGALCSPPHNPCKWQSQCITLSHDPWQGRGEPRHLSA